MLKMSISIQWTSFLADAIFMEDTHWYQDSGRKNPLFWVVRRMESSHSFESSLTSKMKSNMHTFTCITMMPHVCRLNSSEKESIKLSYNLPELWQNQLGQMWLQNTEVPCWMSTYIKSKEGHHATWLGYSRLIHCTAHQGHPFCSLPQ